ncbi:hypothetical protein LCGC14_1452920, partial [marine sediment metagenome]
MTVDAETLRVRQNQLLSPKLRDIGALVFGAGMTGSWVVLGLARMLKRVDVWDFDRVSEENLGTQAYTADDADIDMLKTDALVGICDGLPVYGHAEPAPPEDWRVDRRHSLDTEVSVVVCCVDTIEGRRECAEWAQAEKVPLF